MQNPPKQTNNAPKTKESVQADKSVSALKETPKPQSKATAQVKTKEAYIRAQKVESKTADKTADTVKTKANYIKQHKTAEVKDGIKQKPPVSAPKTRENTALSSSAVPKTKEQAVTDARKKYVSEKLKTKANVEKTAQEGRTEGVPGTDYQQKRTEIFSANENIPKQQTQAVKSEMPAPKVKTENSVDTAFSSKSMPKTKESYMHSQGKTPADIIKTPDRAKSVPKQNTHTVTRNVSSNVKKAVKTKDSLSNGANRAVKTGNSYVGKAVKQKSVKTAKVNYFWGGKSSAIGWDSEWGKLKTVSAEGSKTTGTKRPFGLDCSGFVTWSFINSGFSASAIGHGTQGQIAKCNRISWSQAQAGDLAFLSDLSHVGIIAGKDTSGNILVIHCSSSANNVVITSNSIFGFAARPYCY